MNEENLYLPQNVSSIRCTGTHHKADNQNCDDVVYTYTGPNLEFYGLADGQSGRVYSASGGLRVLQKIAGYMEKTGVVRLCHEKYTDEIQYEIVKIARDTILAMADEAGAKETDFASTLVILAFDPSSKDMLTVHLGDGAIIGVNADNRLDMISSPENGITRQYTWLTTSPQALFHIKVFADRAVRYKRILLVTDGATGICRGKNIAPKAEKLLKEGADQEAILHLTAKSDSRDDASCIVIDF